MVTTPELCIRKEVVSLLGRKMDWDVVVVDEAHRLKSSKSKLNVSRPSAAVSGANRGVVVVLPAVPLPLVQG